MSFLAELTATYQKQSALRDAALHAFAMTYVERVRQAAQLLQPIVEFSTNEMVRSWEKQGFTYTTIVIYVTEVLHKEGLKVETESRQVDWGEYDSVLVVSGWAK